jgi:hypothetical protein
LNVAQASAGQIIDNVNFGAPTDERVNEVGADE